MNKLGVLTAVVLFGFGSLANAQEPTEEPPTVEEGASAAVEEVTPVEEKAPEEVATVEETPAPAAEEAALEADMEAAHDKVEAAGFEEIEAAPVSAAASSSSEAREDTRPASVRLAEGDADKSWGLFVLMDHAMGTGTFMADSTLRSTNAYVAQSWDIRPSYKFDFYGHKLKVMGRILFETEFTTPNDTEGRHFKPSDTSVYLSDPNVFTEPFTDIRFNAGLRYFIPTSYESINVTNRWGAMTLFGGASRTFGPVYLSYGFSYTKNFNSSKGKNGYTDVPVRDANAGLRSGLGVVDPGSTFADGFATSFSLTNSFVVTYNVSNELSVSYSLLVWNLFKYTQDFEGVASSPNADDGRGRADFLWPTLDVTYVVDDLIKPIVELPFTLMVSAGITALHPAQTADNGGIMWPFFYQAFAQDRAANNYGSFYVDIAGVY